MYCKVHRPVNTPGVSDNLARYWGDFDDPDSEVSKLIRERPYKQLLASEGTRPCVYYLV